MSTDSEMQKRGISFDARILLWYYIAINEKIINLSPESYVFFLMISSIIPYHSDLLFPFPVWERDTIRFLFPFLHYLSFKRFTPVKLFVFRFTVIPRLNQKTSCILFQHLQSPNIILIDLLTYFFSANLII